MKVMKMMSRVMMSMINLAIRVTIVTGSKMRMGLSCVMFKVKVR